jgi:hypothetical protein
LAPLRVGFFFSPASSFFCGVGRHPKVSHDWAVMLDVLLEIWKYLIAALGFISGALTVEPLSRAYFL